MKEELSEIEIVRGLISQIKEGLTSSGKKAELELGQKEFEAMIKIMLSGDYTQLMESSNIIIPPTEPDQNSLFSIAINKDKKGLWNVQIIQHPRQPSVEITVSGIEARLKIKNIDLPFDLKLEQLKLTLGNSTSDTVEIKQVASLPETILKQNVAQQIQNALGGNLLMKHINKNAKPFFQANNINLANIGLTITPNQTVRATFQAA